MSNYPPDSAGKAIGTLIVLGMTGFCVYAAVVTIVSPRSAPPAIVHTKTYYEQHANLRTARIKWCQDNPGISRTDPDCQAAFSAAMGW